MTRASDAARDNTDDASGEADRKAKDGASSGSAGSGSSGPDLPSTPEPTPSSGASSAPSKADSGASTGGGPAPARPAGPSGSAPPANPQPPRMRPPLPGPPPGIRMPGPPMPGGFRFAPPPAPRRRLTSQQRGKLFGLAAILVLLGAALGYFVSLAMPATYGAITTIEYNIAGENTGDFLKTDRNLTTQTVLLTSRNVLQPVADANGVNIDDLTKNTSVTILNSSNIIQLEVKDQSPASAVNLANAIAKQYLTVSNASSPKGYVQDQLTAVQKQLASSPAAGNTPANTIALQARQAALQAQLDQMNLTSNQSTVLVAAYPLDHPVSPSGGGSALTGVICGLVIALMATITLSRRWTRS
jgi:capsular polysaccharide biosynthesis protein